MSDTKASHQEVFFNLSLTHPLNPNTSHSLMFNREHFSPVQLEPEVKPSSRWFPSFPINTRWRRLVEERDETH